MSYQVNFKLSAFDCDYWQTEAISKIQKELHDACALVFERNSLQVPMQLSAAEVVYLKK